MSGISRIEVGETVPIALQIPDGNSGLYPQAEIRDDVGTLLATLDLSHEASGVYVPASPYAMPSEIFVKATYVVYTDAPRTVESDAYLRDIDVWIQVVPGDYMADVSALALEATAQAIKDQTDLLPGDPASQSGIEAYIDGQTGDINDNTDAQHLNTISEINNNVDAQHLNTISEINNNVDAQHLNTISEINDNTDAQHLNTISEITNAIDAQTTDISNLIDAQTSAIQSDLGDLETNILTAIDQAVIDINSNTDGTVGTAVTDIINQIQSDLNDQTNTIDGLISASETAIITEIDENQTIIEGVDALLTTVDGKVDNIQTDVTAIDGKIDGIVTTLSTMVADVWSYVSRTLTDFGTLAVDVWSAATRTLTAGTRDTEIDNIETIVTATDGKVDTLGTDLTALAVDVLMILKLTGYNVTRAGDIITIYELDGVTTWRQYDLSNGGRILAT